MKATEAGLLAFLKKSPQFVIPIYQRTYSWTERECRQLWDDIIRAGSDDAISVHFIGSIVYIEAGLSQVSHQAPLLVIDGQQRLTTVTLLLAALAETMGDDEPIDHRYPPRSIQGFLKKDELELAIQRRDTRKPLAPEDINSKIVERYYQTRAIRRVAEAFEKDNLRKALLVMATGSGKASPSGPICTVFA